jgi:hypothetical protein
MVNRCWKHLGVFSVLTVLADVYHIFFWNSFIPGRRRQVVSPKRLYALMLLQDGRSSPSTWCRFSLTIALQGIETDADGCLKRLIGVAVIIQCTAFFFIYNLVWGVFLYFVYCKKSMEVMPIELLAYRQMLHEQGTKNVRGGGGACESS